MKLTIRCFALLPLASALMACGGGSSNKDGATEEQPEATTVLNLSTGTRAAPVTAYFDLDSNEELLFADDDEAAADGDWDIAFRRVDVFLNQSVPTELYYLATENTDSFYDGAGEPIVSRFTSATPDSELAAFVNLDVTVPADDEFNGDETVLAMAGWYNYDFMTHVFTAADDVYFLVDSDDAIAKLRVTDVTVAGASGLSTITFGNAFQAAGEETFAAEQTRVITGATDCIDDMLYVDLETHAAVSASDNWDISMSCPSGVIGFEIHLADDALAVNDQDQTDRDGVAADEQSFLNWQENETVVTAYSEYGDERAPSYGWGHYGLTGEPLLWQNYATYIIRSSEGRNYRFQIINYYDTETSASGAYSFRFMEIEETATP